MDNATQPFKYQHLILYAQFGKTHYTIGDVVTNARDDATEGRSLSVFFSMNLTSHVAQTALRFTAEDDAPPMVIATFASVSVNKGVKRHFATYDELKTACTEGNLPLVVVACSHTTRFGDIYRLLKSLDTTSGPGVIQRVFLYFDEIHEYIDNKFSVDINNVKVEMSVRGLIESTKDFTKVKSCTGMTATMHPVLGEGFWAEIKPVELKEINTSDYRSISGHMRHVAVDDAPKGRNKADYVVGFMRHVLKKYPNVLAPRTFVLAPASFTNASHIALAKEVFTVCVDAVIFIVNQKGVRLYTHDNGGVSVPVVGELKDTIYEARRTRGLLERPTVVTGFKCISTGMTLMHRATGPFTSIVFPDMPDMITIYQFMGRGTGRLGLDWPETPVYCPTNVWDRCLDMEASVTHAMALASEGNNMRITKDTLEKPLREGQAKRDQAKRNVPHTFVPQHTFVPRAEAKGIWLSSWKQNAEGKFILSLHGGVGLVHQFDELENGGATSAKWIIGERKPIPGNTYTRKIPCYRNGVEGVDVLTTIGPALPTPAAL